MCKGRNLPWWVVPTDVFVMCLPTWLHCSGFGGGNQGGVGGYWGTGGTFDLAVEQGETLPLYEGEDTLSNLTCYCDDGSSIPGNDHFDDNYSAANSSMLNASFSDRPVGARIPPRVAILQRGSARNLQCFAFQVGELGAFVAPDFDPVLIVEHFPVILIPSGSLYGLENSSAFHARLEEYARLGGVIVVFSCLSISASDCLTCTGMEL